MTELVNNRWWNPGHVTEKERCSPVLPADTVCNHQLNCCQATKTTPQATEDVLYQTQLSIALSADFYSVVFCYPSITIAFIQ